MTRARASTNFKENSIIKLNIIRIKVYTITLIDLGKNTNIISYNAYTIYIGKAY